ncbi:MAG: TetR family transcriptional regulator [Deltaproteobacteria bacterium]|nr:TetR family transcriptional regulator [Deltaproteobacteria bacterium]
MAEATTRERILGAADRLFGSHGFRGTSLRALTREAGVNLAAVHYHFGSKHELLVATLSRHIDAINAARIAQLDALEAAHPNGDIPPLDLLNALVRPAFAFRHASPENAEVVQRLSALLHSEPLEIVHPLMEGLFSRVMQRFAAALERALPDLEPEEVYLRIQITIGAMVSALAGRHPPDLADAPGLDEEERIDHLVHFLAAGFSAKPLNGVDS